VKDQGRPYAFMPFIFKAFITLVADSDAVSDPATQKALISNSTIIKSSDKKPISKALNWDQRICLTHPEK